MSQMEWLGMKEFIGKSMKQNNNLDLLLLFKEVGYLDANSSV